ncbi:MAG: cellulose binding domain-containing protein [Clostridiales bacterium]|jgi:hypothetical protein|nr:cellulose binding domain-containing protein [Clostridiales bacterium]
MIAFLLSIIMTQGFVHTLAAPFDTETKRTYTYDGFTVGYEIANSWGNNQNINVTITNTGMEAIENWMLSYEFHGDVIGVWNGILQQDESEIEYIMNAEHNAVIHPGNSVNFGYSLSNATGFPESFSMIQERVLKENGYTVELGEINSWGSGFTGQIIIKNQTNFPIVGWELIFDSNFVIANLNDSWSASLTNANNGQYKLKGTYMNIIRANSSISLYFNGSVNGVPEIFDYCLTEMIKGESNSDIDTDDTSDTDSSADTDTSTDNDSSADIDTSTDSDTSADTDTSTDTYKPQLPQNLNDLAAFGIHDTETNSIIVEWSYKDTQGEFRIYEHSDDKALIGEVSGRIYYVFPIESMRSQYHFTVEKYVSDGDILISNDVIMKLGEDGIYRFEHVDSDKDDLYDLIELIMGTDRYVSDTDGDSLPDGYEHNILGTNPLMYDTSGEGKSDGDYDFDDDGFTNYEEYLHGTDPLADDSDLDGLTDGDEVKIYGTNPINRDTDGDGISDGEEIELGLDPLNTQSSGYPDSEHTVWQTVGIDDNRLWELNEDENNPYSVSFEIKSAGVASKNITYDNSRYADQIKYNAAVLGIVPEFNYTDGLSVDDVIIKFHIDHTENKNVLGTYAAVSPAFEGIKRFSIFKFFEGIDILVPIETFYDIENGIVYSQVDELGTYCIIDMELWFNDIGMSPSDLGWQPQLEPVNLNSAGINTPMAVNDISDDNSFSGMTLIGRNTNLEDEILELEKDNQMLSDIVIEPLKEENISPAELMIETVSSQALTARVLSDSAKSGWDFYLIPSYKEYYHDYIDFVLSESYKVFSEYNNVRVYIINYDGTLLKTASGGIYAEKYSQVKKMMKQFNPETPYNFTQIANTFYNLESRSSLSHPNIENFDFANYVGFNMAAPFGYTDLCFFVNMLTTSSEMSTVKSFITENGPIFYEENVYGRIYIIDSLGNVLTTNSGSNFADNMEDLNEMVSKLTYTNMYNFSAIDYAYWQLCLNSYLQYNVATMSKIPSYLCYGASYEYGVPQKQKKTYSVLMASGIYKMTGLDDPITEDYLEMHRLAKTVDRDTLNAICGDYYADTDGDGLYDFEELMFEYNGVQLINWNENGEVVFLSLDTLRDIFNDKPYIQNSVETYFSPHYPQLQALDLTKYNEPLNGTFAESYSYIDPAVIDQDKNCNGIPDFLTKNLPALEKGQSIYEHEYFDGKENEIFYLVSASHSRLEKNVPQNGDFVVYPLPREARYIGYNDTNVVYSDKFEILRIVISNGELWFKIKIMVKNSDDYRIGYIKASIVDDYETITERCKGELALLNDINHGGLVVKSTSHDAIANYSVINGSEDDKTFYKRNMDNTLKLTARDLYVLEFACNSVASAYSNDGRFFTTRTFLQDKLKPEILLAIACDESNYFGDDMMDEGGFGIVNIFPLNTEVALNRAIGSTELNLHVIKNRNEFANNLYLGMKAGAVLFAYHVRMSLSYAADPRLGEKLKSILKNPEEFDAETEDLLLSDVDYGQLIFNSHYIYTAGVAATDYYGFRDKDGDNYPNNQDGIGAPATAVKCIAYVLLYEKMGKLEICPLLRGDKYGVINDDGTVNLNNLANKLSDYTELDGVNQYKFEIIE